MRHGVRKCAGSARTAVGPYGRNTADSLLPDSTVLVRMPLIGV